MAKASLVDIATSGASPEVVLELMAKQLEKRLQALEAGGKQAYVSAVETQMADIMAILSKQKPSITVQAAEQPAPIINVAAPAVTVVEKEPKQTTKIVFERNLAGTIESATIVKSKE